MLTQHGFSVWLVRMRDATAISHSEAAYRGKAKKELAATVQYTEKEKYRIAWSKAPGADHQQDEAIGTTVTIVVSLQFGHAKYKDAAIWYWNTQMTGYNFPLGNSGPLAYAVQYREGIPMPDLPGWSTVSGASSNSKTRPAGRVKIELKSVTGADQKISDEPFAIFTFEFVDARLRPRAPATFEASSGTPAPTRTLPIRAHGYPQLSAGRITAQQTNEPEDTVSTSTDNSSSVPKPSTAAAVPVLPATPPATNSNTANGPNCLLPLPRSPASQPQHAALTLVSEELTSSRTDDVATISESAPSSAAVGTSSSSAILATTPNPQIAAAAETIVKPPSTPSKQPEASIGGSNQNPGGSSGLKLA